MKKHFFILLSAAMFISVIARAQSNAGGEEMQLKPDESTSKIEDKNYVYTIVEQMPEFPGGQANMSEYLSKHIKYPSNAIKTKKEGKVFVSFVVSWEGKVKDVELLRGVDKELDKEAMRVVKEMPDWKPGKMDGKTVSVRYNLPIMFKL